MSDPAHPAPADGQGHGLTDKLKHLHLHHEHHNHQEPGAEEGHGAHSALHGVKAKLLEERNKIGKFANIFNPNHRHDEKHEQETDDKRSRISQSHRFGSFAPEREGNNIKWYVDGRDYFWAVSVALERAKETIYIADWWLSPELFLRRPPSANRDWRLDRVLKRRAEAGVQIYVAVYKEVARAITCNSNHTKNALRNLCPKGSPGHGNIHVMRHPDHNFLENAGDMTFYWAHHEKFIVIDYNLAFIGGLDLCFGRWDNLQHPLADVHPSGVMNEVWPGQDWNNNRIMDFQNVEDWTSNALDKSEYGRMPWHDVAMGVVGPCVYDIAEHFILRWNLVKRDKYKRDPRFPWLVLQGRDGPDEDLVGVQRPKHPEGGYVHHPLSPLNTKALGRQGSVHAQIVRSSSDWSSGILTEHSIQNAYIEIIRNAQHYVYIENQFFITSTGDQQSPVHNKIGRAIVEACVRAGREGRKFRVIAVIPAVPGFAGDLRSDAATGTRAIMDYQYKSILRGEHSIFGQIAAQGVDPKNHIFFFNLRSYDRLNKNEEIRRQERESGVKYQDAARAKDQEVMGEGLKTAPDHHWERLRHGPGYYEDEDSDHDTGHRLRKKVGSLFGHNHEDEEAKRAEQRRKFEAAGGEKKREDPIFGADSIAEDALLGGGKVSDEEWLGDPEDEKKYFVQEELYIHAKLLIVDDRIVLCGSSNINDRSQLGSHDSELSIVMEDTRKLQSRMNGQPYEAGFHAATLRRHLWREHMGLLYGQTLDASDDPNAQPPDVCGNDVRDGDEYAEFVADPLDDRVWETWTSRASKNTEIFRRLFHADPDDNVKTFEDYDRFLPSEITKAGHLFDPYIPTQEVRELLDQVKGHLVWMPMDFLRDAHMAEPGLQVNSWTESIYT